MLLGVLSLFDVTSSMIMRCNGCGLVVDYFIVRETMLCNNCYRDALPEIFVLDHVNPVLVPMRDPSKPCIHIYIILRSSGIGALPGQAVNSVIQMLLNTVQYVCFNLIKMVLFIFKFLYTAMAFPLRNLIKVLGLRYRSPQCRASDAAQHRMMPSIKRVRDVKKWTFH